MKVVVPIAMLLPELDFNNGTKIFDEILTSKGFKVLGNKWWLFMNEARDIDNKFKSSEISNDDFRQAIVGRFSDYYREKGEENALNISDKEFDQAWNAMLGDVTLLKTQLEALQKGLPRECDLVLTSGMDSIHFGHIKSNSGVSFENIPLYKSHLLKKSGAGFYNHVIQELKKESDIILIITGTSEREVFEKVKKLQEEGNQGPTETKKNVYYKELGPLGLKREDRNQLILKERIQFILDEVNKLLPKSSPHP